VSFLRLLWESRDGVSSNRTWRSVKELMLEQEMPAYRLFGKTGWQGAVSLPDGTWAGFAGPEQLGWYVGVVDLLAVSMFSL